MISTRGRYALRVIIDLAENADAGLIPMHEVAKRQGISLKYLERILPELVSGHLVEGVHGKGGGYRRRYRTGGMPRGQRRSLRQDGRLPYSSVMEGIKRPHQRVLRKR